MSLRMALFALAAIAFASATNARAAPAEEISDNDARYGVLIAPPPGARLVGSAVVDEVRSFPELGQGKKTLQQETQAGVAGIDRIYEIDRSHAETIAYFDDWFKATGSRIVSRVQTRSATAWRVKRPDGNVANAVVRNTSPTTIELTEVSAAPAKMPPR